MSALTLFLSVDLSHRTRRCILLSLLHPHDLQAIKQENDTSAAEMFYQEKQHSH